jgi:hypothetical protein
MRNAIVFAAICLAATAAGATTVSGYVYYEHPYQSSTLAPNGTQVKLCTLSNGVSGYQNPCYAASSSGGFYSLGIVDSSRDYYVFMWNDADEWGSPNAPSYTFNPQSGAQAASYPVGTAPNYSIPITGQPRPHAPYAVYPSVGDSQVPTAFTLQWTSGVDDPDRQRYVTTYDIYANGQGSPPLLQYYNVSCFPDAQGNCRYTVSGVASNALIYWSVVAKINTNLSWDPFHTTPSRQFWFWTRVDPNARYSFQMLWPRTFLSGVNGWSCGGGAMSHDAYGAGNCESFYLWDENGGDINSGDVIHLYMNGYYVAAEGGGGDPTSVVNVNRGVAGPWETFTLERVNGYGRILNGDLVAIKCINGYYMTPETDGTVTCNRTSIGAWEQFSFGVQ